MKSGSMALCGFGVMSVLRKPVPVKVLHGRVASELRMSSQSIFV
jgi:hypothetical protein